MGLRSPADLPSHAGGMVVTVIETPRGSRNKIKFDPDLGVFRLDRILPAGLAFPFDFGFIPGTRAEDGDPLDVLVLLDQPVHPGCIVLVRLLGVIEVEQQKGGGGPAERNDRLVAVPGGPKAHTSLRTLRDVDTFTLDAIGAFFEAYHALDGDVVRILGRKGVNAAEAAIRRATTER